MALKTIGNLSAASTITGAEKLELEQSGGSVYASVQGIMSAYGLTTQTVMGIGGIVETLTTTGSSYIKLPGNFMVTFGAHVTSVAVGTTSVSIINSSVQTVTFPLAYATAPTVVPWLGKSADGGGSYFLTHPGFDVSSTSFLYVISNVVVRAATSRTVYWVAFGTYA